MDSDSLPDLPHVEEERTLNNIFKGSGAVVGIKTLKSSTTESFFFFHNCLSRIVRIICLFVLKLQVLLSATLAGSALCFSSSSCSVLMTFMSCLPGDTTVMVITGTLSLHHSPTRIQLM